MAAYYAADSRPRKAIEMLDRILEEETKNADALRARGDALLSVGKHAEAIKDYTAALEIEPEDTGVLNNLAWVLSTSPQDAVRNGKRAIELATKACELTKFKKPHILSTLASAYAEAGDFDKAVEWSAKAVELGGDELKEQLKKELDGYKEKKPFRESQNIEENTKPLDPKKNNDDLET
jgi:tetratricopeptide (TPR) repeat protein